jgi:hypothetical protein
MKKFNWKSLLPHVLAIGIFLIVSVIYCLPAFKGMVVNMHDVLGWKGMAQQSLEFKEKYGHLPLWTNSMFGGMPAFQIAYESSNPISLGYFHYLFTLGLPHPANLFFLACICFYILCLSLNMRSWVGTLSSLAYSFASYSVIITVVGHTSKFASMAYAPAVIAGLILLTQRKYILGFIVTLLFTSLLVGQNHLQIVYYTLIVAICLGVAFAIRSIRKKEFKPLITSGVLALIAGLIGFASFAVMVMPLNEYVKETMRGGRSELVTAKNKDNKTNAGLNKDYAFMWSYGVDETLTMALPDYKGGSSGPAEIGENSKAVEAMQNAQFPAQAINSVSPYFSSYWGEQLSTSGPVYLGAIICILFIAGLFVVKNENKGWIIAASIIGILMAWGSNFKAFNYFLFDHLPLYNKFRAPSMSLVIPQLTFPLLAGLALQTLCYGNYDVTAMNKKLKQAGIAGAALIVILLFTYVSSDFKSKNDVQLKDGLAQMISGNNPAAKDQATITANSIMNGLSADRKALYGGDLLRTLLLIIGTGAIVWLVVNKKLKAQTALIILTAATFTDLITVDNRYLKTDSYIDKDEFTASLNATSADLQIKRDTSFYRVFEQNDPWQNSRTAYHHNSVGGYSPVKLGLYQDLIDSQLSKGNMHVFNMLNTKYFILENPQTRQPAAQQNPDAFGNAWLVKSIQYVNNANEEMKALDSITKDIAIVDKREQPNVTLQPQYDSSGTITLVENKNDYIKYNFNATSNQFVVFSEIYYPYGWTATIDGKEAAIVKTNYLLRGLSVPAGKHEIVFEFKPKSVITGDRISLALAILSYIIIIVGLFLLWKQYNKKEQ